MTKDDEVKLETVPPPPASSDDSFSDSKSSSTSGEEESSDSFSSSSRQDVVAIGAGPMPQRSGSRITLPQVLSRRKWTESRASHIQRVEGRGKSFMKQERRKRKRIRSGLKGQEHAAHFSSLASSSEEEGQERSEKELKDMQKDFLDWYSMADNSWAGTEGIFDAMPVREISSLVGWATHYTKSGADSMHPRDRSETPSANIGTIKNQPTQLDSSKAAGFFSQGPGRPSLSTTPQTPCSPNPLLFLPNAPLPPSCLHFITKRVENWVRISMQDESSGHCKWEQRLFLGHRDTSDEDNRLKRKRFKTQWGNFQRKEFQKDKWTYDDKDESYRLFQSFARTKNVEVTVPVPCDEVTPQTTSGEEKANRAAMQLFRQSFDLSALVALGMVVEEALTATFLPLAELHVARCRELERKKTSIHQKGDLNGEQFLADDPFHEWTLPPAEALTKLVGDCFLRNQEQHTSLIERETSGLASTYPPALVNHRLRIDETARAPMVAESVLDSLSPFPELTRSQYEQRSLSIWCKSHGLEPSFVSDNMDLFGMFLPLPPIGRPKRLYERSTQVAEEQKTKCGNSNR